QRARDTDAMRGSMLSLGFLIVVSCGGAPPPTQTPAAPEPPAAAPSPASSAHVEAAKGTDGVACVGVLLTPPDGLKERQVDALLVRALDVTDKGKLCSGKVFEAAGGVT